MKNVCQEPTVLTQASKIYFYWGVVGDREIYGEWGRESGRLESTWDGHDRSFRRSSDPLVTWTFSLQKSLQVHSAFFPQSCRSCQDLLGITPLTYAPQHCASNLHCVLSPLHVPQRYWNANGTCLFPSLLRRLSLKRNTVSPPRQVEKYLVTVFPPGDYRKILKNHMHVGWHVLITEDNMG